MQPDEGLRGCAGRTEGRLAYDVAVNLLQIRALRLTGDEQGRPQLDAAELSALLHTKDEKDRRIIEELVRRLEQRNKWRAEVIATEDDSLYHFL